MLYQDVLTNMSDDASSAFFELANEKKVAYKCRNGSQVTITQDQDIEDCTVRLVNALVPRSDKHIFTTLSFESLLMVPDTAVISAGRNCVGDLVSACHILGAALAHMRLQREPSQRARGKWLRA
jgi:hypothetical protein